MANWCSGAPGDGFSPRRIRRNGRSVRNPAARSHSIHLPAPAGTSTSDPPAALPGEATGHQVLRNFLADGRHRPQLIIQVAGPAKSVTGQPAALVRGPGQLRSAPVEGRQQRAAVRAENLVVPGQDLRQFVRFHGPDGRSVPTTRRNGSGGHHQAEPLQPVFRNEAVTAVERLAGGGGIQAYAALARQRPEGGFHQLPSHAEAPVGGVHQHHAEPGEAGGIAQEGDRPQHGAARFRHPSAAVRRIQKRAPVILHLVPAAQPAQAEAVRNVRNLHRSDVNVQKSIVNPGPQL